MTTYNDLAQNILDGIGGKDNISMATHCMTRLRFNVKDESTVDGDAIRNTSGVLGINKSGGQYQVIIGQQVPKVYKALTSIAGIASEEPVDENVDKKIDWSPKAIGMSILNYLSGSMTPLIPGMLTAAMFKTIQALLGPDLLNLISVESDMYLLTEAMYNAFFYFLPVFIGFTAAKKLGVSQVLGMLLGTLLVVPDLVALEGQTFSIYGLFPTTMHNYAQTVLPIILSVWVMSYVESFFKKIIPDVLSTIFVPFLTMLIMVPVSLVALAPLGNIFGAWIGNGLIAFGSVGGFLALGVVAALWSFLVMTGMHQVLIVFGITSLLETGVDTFVLTAGGIATWAAFGMAFGGFLRIRNKEEKALALGYVVSGLIGGVTEPVLYGLGVKYKRPFIAMMIGGFIGGIYASIMNVGSYLMGATNFLALLTYVAGGRANLINGCISVAIAFGVTAVLTYLFGFDKNDPALQKS